MCHTTNAGCYIQLNAMAELIYKYVVETLLYFYLSTILLIDTYKVISYNDETNTVLNNNIRVIVGDVR